MARYSYNSYGRGTSRIRRWLYVISGWILVLLIVAAVFAFIYGYHPFSKNEYETTPEKETELPVLSEPEPNLPKIAAKSIAEPNSKATNVIAEAMELINAKPARIIEARDKLNDEALPICQSSEQRAIVKKLLSGLADRWLFSRKIFPQDSLCGSYKVEPGDQLRTIGEQFKVSWEILSEINKVRPENLPAGGIIKVIKGPFHARIHCSTFTMDLYLQNAFVRSFSVGLGMPGKETPTGLWLVKPGGKLERPRWTNPATGRTYEPDDPNYPLGSRWIGLEGLEGEAKDRDGFAIHGTKDPEEIGTAGSQGCIRMDNGDAILMYNLLMPGFSRVEVVE